jgi:putative SOS response-associated peptidase YedK
MCTRFILERAAAQAGFARLGLEALSAAVASAIESFNIPPGTRLTAVRASNEFFSPHWGFRAPATDPARSLLVNARSETLAERPAFRDAFRLRRCLIPATGFYEWEKRGAGRLPWLFRLADSAPFAFAGLWSPASETETDAVMVTTAANSTVGRLHDRMPVMLTNSAACETWLDPRASTDALAALFIPLSAAALHATPVSPRINQPAFNSPACLTPAVHGLAPRSTNDSAPEFDFS